MKIAYQKPPLYGVVIFLFITLSPLFTNAQNIDFGKSYINVTKGLNGGTLETGDTLEIRAAFVVRSGTYDSCAYFDVIPAGTAYIPGTIRVLTNEGKIYKQFTDAMGDDPGWRSGSNIRINLGYRNGSFPATAFRRGRVANNHRPSFYGSTCIMIASFRVRITSAVGTQISTGGGTMTYRRSGSSLQSHTFPANTIAVYNNYGMCSNSVGTNALGTEFNGTFGSGVVRNRGTSANVPPSYTYNVFTSNTPNDYFYGIANNTSTINNYTTSNAWSKPDGSSPTHRVFSVWDIIGDHTNAADPSLGNQPADTVANPNGGYMLVINASYRIDSAFQQTISNLCPNTYYEISCWVRNICSRCGCDSSGRGASSSGYIPTAPGDSSGVYPNLTFEVDGVDYYTTGNILYTGQWIKKGFTFLTGPTQTSFTLKFFNNAPGGGGNDWALDDISVATCSPNLAFTPDNDPTVCVGNVVDIGCFIRSYFGNYVNYKWQRSTDNGVSWTDEGTPGTGTPAWNGTTWEYYVAHPQFVATMADSGLKFRVVVATTIANLTDPECSFSEVASVLTLNVIDCGLALETDILSFSGKMENNSVLLNWTTSREEEVMRYFVQRSSDGVHFDDADIINGYENINADINYYSWNEVTPSRQAIFYRIKMVAGDKHKYSRIIKIASTAESVSFINVPNPFTHTLQAEVNSASAQIVYLQLIDNFGKIVLTEKFPLTQGFNNLQMSNTESLAKGLYTLQLKAGNVFLHKRVMKL